MSVNSKGTILYIGGFELPDKNAAAHRVLNNGRILRNLGYNVVMAGIDRENHLPLSQQQKSLCRGFLNWGLMYTNRRLYSISDFIYLYGRYKSDLCAVIAYNFPSVALDRIRRFCQKRCVKIISDCTEWYRAEGANVIRKAIKGIDSFLRMYYVHPKLDGMIVISHYLESYYENKLPTICLPPLTDISEEKWSAESVVTHDGLHIVYAGNPGANKDLMGKIIEAISMCDMHDVHFIVIGISQEQYLYDHPAHLSILKQLGQAVSFQGRLPHEEVIHFLKQADFSMFYREKSRVTMAGFPTKLSESISCGTPVITNKTSDISEYLKDGINGFILDDNIATSLNNILSVARTQCKKIKQTMDSTIFDYHRFEEPMRNWFEIIKL